MILNTQSLIAAANEDMGQLLPVQHACAPDLVNRTPTDLTHRADGGRIAGSILAHDIYPGSASPAVWGYAIPFMTASAVAVILGTNAMVLGTYVPLANIGHVFAESKLAGATIGAAVASTFFSTLGGMWKFAFIAWLPVAAMGAFTWLAITEKEATRDTFRWFGASFGVISAAMILFPVLGPLAIMLTGISGIFAPRMISFLVERARLQTLKDVTEGSKSSSVSNDRKTMEEIRRKQAADSLRDTTPRIQIAESMDVLRSDGDILTPDAGAMMEISVADTSTHLAVAGRTGAGKSVFFKRFVAAWVQSGYGGSLILDPGKGELPTDVKEHLNYLVTPENFNLNLLDGLDPEIAAKIIYDVTASNSKDSGVWDKGAEKLFRYALYILRDARKIPRLRPVVHYSLMHMYKFCENEAFRTEIINNLPEAESGPARMAREYWTLSYPNEDSGIKMSLKLTVDSAISSIVINEKLQKWTSGFSDANIIEAVVRGAIVGVSAPPAVYGLGGVLATALVKGALYNRISGRVLNKNWRDTEKPVALIIDECVKAISDNDADFAAIGRGIGCHILAAFQDVERIEHHTGSAEACMAFLNQFQSWICFTSSKKTIEIVCEKAGKRQRRVLDKNKTEGTSLHQNLRVNQESGLADDQRGRLLDGIAGITAAFTRVRKSFSLGFHAHSNQDDHDAQRKSSTIQFTYEEGPTISVIDAQKQLERRFTALVVLNRAGSPRREICDFTPDFAK